MRAEGVIRALKAAEPELRALGAASLYLFGSVARGEDEAQSDVDVFIDPDPDRVFGFDGFMDVYETLERRLGSTLSFTTRDGLHPLLRDSIERSSIQVF